jgi:hypothetical protein
VRRHEGPQRGATQQHWRGPGALPGDDGGNRSHEPGPPSLVGDGGGNAEGCSEESKLVYVLSLEGDVYSFAPALKKFTKIGRLDCGPIGGSHLVPISMAVDRSAVAWVNLWDDPGKVNRLYKFDIKAVTCSPTGILGDFGGLGFSTDQGSSNHETLFVTTSSTSNTNTDALATIDFSLRALKPLGDLSSMVGELTGTGDDRLYGLVLDTPLTISQIDKTSFALARPASLANVEMPVEPMYAFSFWGGDFYIYTATSTSPSQTTNVARYRPSDGSVDTSYMTSIGFHIVGAGVSTCAPTTPVQ